MQIPGRETIYLDAPFVDGRVGAFGGGKVDLGMRSKDVVRMGCFREVPALRSVSTNRHSRNAPAPMRCLKRHTVCFPVRVLLALVKTNRTEGIFDIAELTVKRDAFVIWPRKV